MAPLTFTGSVKLS